MFAWVCVGDREALLDSVPPWQHSLWPDTGGRGRSVRAKTGMRRKRREGGTEGGREGRSRLCSVRLGCESPQGGERRGEDSAVEGELDLSQ